MSKQIDLFTAAIGHKQKALKELHRLALTRARTELETAQEIDPYLADLKTLLEATEFLLTLGIHPKTRSSGLTRAWQKVQEVRSALPRAVHSVAETLICERAITCLPPDYSDFVDPERKILHIGYCYLVLNRFEEAHKTLLDYLTAHPEESHPELWGYFGDASYQLKRHKEWNGGYLRALFMDAQMVDMERIQHPELKRIFEELRRQHPEETARALLPIYSCLEGVLHIPRGNTWLAWTIRKQRFGHGTELLLYPAQRYHQFALCLYIDQSGSGDDIDFDARAEMQRLDAELFHEYLARLAGQ